jgi:hypothetical protein
MAGSTRLELATSGVTGRRPANQAPQILLALISFERGALRAARHHGGPIHRARPDRTARRVTSGPSLSERRHLIEPRTHRDGRKQSPVTGNGNGLPAPPQCLQKVGRFQGGREEPRGVEGDVESASYQQFDRKSAISRQFLKRCWTSATPGASTLTSLAWAHASLPTLTASSGLRPSLAGRGRFAPLRQRRAAASTAVDLADAPSLGLFTQSTRLW